MSSPVEHPSRGSDTAVTRAHWLGVAAFLALGTALRAHELSSRALWIDEYGTWWAIAGEGFAEVWRRVVEIQGQSPLYYLWVRGVVDVLGPGALALRLPSFVCGVALLPLAYLAGLRSFGDRRAALAALAVFALDERLVFYSGEARPYALALLCATASFLFYLELLRGAGARARIGWALSTAATWYSHYLFGVLLLVQALHYAWQLRSPPRRLRDDATTFALTAVLLAPGALQLLRVFARRDTLDWLPESQGILSALVLAGQLVDLRVLASVAGSVVAAVLLGSAFSRPKGRLGLVLLWLGVPFALIALVPPLFGVNLLNPRYLLVAVPAVALLYASLICVPRSGWLRWLPLWTYIAATAVLRIGPMLEGGGLFGSFYREQHWASATAALVERYREGEVVLYATKFVELDEVVRGNASAATEDFVSWPVRAHLPRDRHFELVPLPFSDAALLAGEIRDLRRKPEATGVWIIGLSPVAERAVKLGRRQPGLRVVGESLHGVVRLVHLTRLD